MRKRANKLKWWQIALRIVAGIVGFIFCLYCFSGIVNACVNSTRNKYAKSYGVVDYSGAQIIPEYEDGYYTFTTDNDLKIMQLTDVHIGGGYWSVGRDKMAINAVATMITAEKPDLVIVTGDIAYPVPFQTGTLNNKAGAKTMATLMETLGVYWTVCFGNHDTEAYSYFDREEICEYYTQKNKDGTARFPHCLLNDMGGDEVSGYANQVIKIKNTAGVVKHAVFVFDSHAYLDDDPFGIKWHYDYIKQDQVDWYANEIKKINDYNATNGAEGIVKSTAYFHIPLLEMRDAYQALVKAGVNTFANTGETLSLVTEPIDGTTVRNVTYFEGTFGENPEKKMVYSSDTRTSLFAKMAELQSTQAVFSGHDHVNNCIAEVDGIKLVYGMSIDYLAYNELKHFGRQRGCTIITIDTTGGVDVDLKNYYDNYDVPAKEREKIDNTSGIY